MRTDRRSDSVRTPVAPRPPRTRLAGIVPSTSATPRRSRVGGARSTTEHGNAQATRWGGATTRSVASGSASPKRPLAAGSGEVGSVAEATGSSGSMVGNSSCTASRTNSWSGRSPKGSSSTTSVACATALTRRTSSRSRDQRTCSAPFPTGHACGRSRHVSTAGKSWLAATLSAASRARCFAGIAWGSSSPESPEDWS